PLRQDVLVQLALTIGEKLVEYRLYVGRRDDRLSAGVAQRGSHLDENIVAGGLRIRVRAVEMDVAGRRAVETVGKLIESRVFVGCDLAALVVLGDRETLVAALPLLAAIERIPRDFAAKLIHKAQLDDVADAGAQGRARHRILIGRKGRI